MNHRFRTGIAVAAVSVAALPFLSGASTPAEAEPRPVGPGYDILFVRHAHSYYPAPEQELSQRGIAQATALAQRLHDAPIASVDTSMMLRAFQTGDNIAADHNLPVEADESIGEVAFDVSDVPPAEQGAHMRGIMEAWLNGEERSNGFGGESYDDVVARWTPWWEKYVRDHRNERGTGIVVAHGGLLSLMLQRTCDNEVTPQFALDNGIANTGIVEARIDPVGNLTCSVWSGVPVPSAS